MVKTRTNVWRIYNQNITDQPCKLLHKMATYWPVIRTSTTVRQL